MGGYRHREVCPPRRAVSTFSELASDGSFFIFMFWYIPTRDLNPIYTVPMLGTQACTSNGG